MKVTKHGHACVAIEVAGTTLVIDPGSFTAADAVANADAVLITHEHFDHLWPENLAATEAPIFTHQAVRDALAKDHPELAERVQLVAPGESFQAAEVPVTAVGEWHAVIHADYPQIHNLGYLIAADAKVLHPGDALVGAEQAIDVLLTPVSAPWLKVGEAVDFVRHCAAPLNLAIHDQVYSEVGLGMVATHMQNLLPSAQSYQRLEVGGSVSLPVVKQAT